MIGIAHMHSQKSKGRSRVTNGKSLLRNTDGRSSRARRYRDLVDHYMAEFGIMDESDLALARSLAGTSLYLEEQQAKRLRGEPVDDAAVTTASNTQRRQINDLRKSARRRGVIR